MFILENDSELVATIKSGILFIISQGTKAALVHPMIILSTFSAIHPSDSYTELINEVNSIVCKSVIKINY